MTDQTTPRPTEARDAEAGDSVKRLVGPSRLYDAREKIPQWIAFADYFKKHEGFEPTPGDERVEMLYNYYLIGSWDFEAGRHNR